MQSLVAYCHDLGLAEYCQVALRSYITAFLSTTEGSYATDPDGCARILEYR